jgi:transposase
VIGLPSLAALDHSATTRIWLATAPADMRCGFDRLAELARVVTNQNPMDGHLFLFRSRHGDRLKILLWDRDGFVLWYKRLEEGVFKLPRIDEGRRKVGGTAGQRTGDDAGRHRPAERPRRAKRYSRKRQTA